MHLRKESCQWEEMVSEDRIGSLNQGNINQIKRMTTKRREERKKAISLLTERFSKKTERSEEEKTMLNRNSKY